MRSEEQWRVRKRGKNWNVQGEKVPGVGKSISKNDGESGESSGVAWCAHGRNERMKTEGGGAEDAEILADVERWR